jgi:hypothetical protein
MKLILIMKDSLNKTLIIIVWKSYEKEIKKNPRISLANY